jgi:glycosyltransferase involved in cell wall biosynthesis
LQQRHFPESRRILFIHTAPEEIELYEAGRPGATASAHAEKRVDLQRRLAAGCSLIVAVGSRLQREFETQMQGKPEVDRIVTFTPAVDTSEERPVNNPPGIQCLVLGRADHRILKGLDVAARSVGSIAARWTGPNRPKLVVRGAPVGAGDDLRAELIAESDCNQLEVIVREYSPQSEKIQEDFYRASVLLMPSRAEGFGLVGLEAISCGIPILITHESGLAEMLREYARIESEGWILPVGHDAEKSSPLWAAALCKILEDRAAAFEKARALRTKLEFAVSWDGEAQKLLARLRGAALQE